MVTQSGLSVTFSEPVKGQCGDSTSVTGSAILSSLSSSTVLFTLLGQQFVATRSDNTVSVANQQFPQCSGSAICTGGACLSSSSSTATSPSLQVSVMLSFFLVAAFAVALV